MNNVEYGTKIYDTLEVIGPYILIERFENEEHKIGDIIIPDSKEYANDKMGVGRIVEIGNKAKLESNLDVGDYVLFDYYSIFCENRKHVIINYENIFMQMNKEESIKFLNGSLL